MVILISYAYTMYYEHKRTQIKNIMDLLIHTIKDQNPIHSNAQYDSNKIWVDKRVM